MRIHADPTTDGTGIALDVDHPNTLQTFGPDFIPRGVVLTPAEAAELRDELTRALDKIAPKTRTSADVLTGPQPGDEIRFSNGDIWRAANVTPRVVHFIEMGDDGRVAVAVGICTRDEWAQRSPRREACPRGTPNPWQPSDVPPPTP